MTTRGWVDTRGVPGFDQTEILPSVQAVDRRTARTASAFPSISVTVVLVDLELRPRGWSDYVADIRTALDQAAAQRVEGFSCGASGTRQAIWYATVDGAVLERLARDLRQLADYWRGSARLTYAPCSPVDL